MKNNFTKWALIREKGRKSYVIKYGVIGWGVSTAILFILLFALLQNEHYSLSKFLTILIPSLIVFPLGGVFWGLYMWNYLEAKYVNFSK